LPLDLGDLAEIEDSMFSRLAIAATLVGLAGPAQAQRASQHPRIGQLAELAFAPDSADARGNEEQLGMIAGWAADNPGGYVVLDGHADRTGSDRANMQLSLRRAGAVRDRLIELGVERDQIVITGYGAVGTHRRDVVAWGTHTGLQAIAKLTLARGGTAALWPPTAVIATR
jgi:flagellar motor protein MotB